MADITSAIGGSIPNPSFSDVYPFITNPTRYDELKKYPNRVGKSFIAEKKFVMCVRNSMTRYLKSLADEMDFAGGILIYSFWSGYKDTESMQTFLEECQELGLKIVTLHTSGHADSKAIEELINRVHPKKIIPVHTENAEWFKNLKKQNI